VYASKQGKRRVRIAWKSCGNHVPPRGGGRGKSHASRGKSKRMCNKTLREKYIVFVTIIAW